MIDTVGHGGGVLGLLFCTVFEIESLGEDKEDDGESFRYIGRVDDREGLLEVWTGELEDTRAGEEEGLGDKEEFALVEFVLVVVLVSVTVGIRVIRSGVGEEETDAHSLGVFWGQS